MTNEELKDLKARLWQTADQLRSGSGLKSSQYSAPILGLIFLRFADSKYSRYEKEILDEYNKSKGTRAEKTIHEIATIKCGFYLPDNARYDVLLNLPEGENLALKIKEAMLEIEKYSPNLEGVLPKDEYYTINSSEDKSLLKKLLKNFKDIPDNTGIDIFGEIYEYFLGEFALSEGQGGGEFFTPSTVVRYMVEVLAPTEGKILDPACGSGGMFVQTAHYIQRHKEKHGEDSDINLRAYGVEKTGETVKLAKMNLVLNNIRGEVIEANSYYSDPHDSYGAFDYVMANPPFNVDEVELDLVKTQRRFNEYGIPQNKTKTSKKDSDKTEKVPNANYLWINQFATALRPNGRAALVMPNSASDVGLSEKDIRIKLIESGIISQMVALPTNMFNTVTLPATLWFFDKSKSKKNEILFIDARNIFTVVDRSHRKFSDEQIKNLSIISRLYEGKSDEFYSLLNEYKFNMESLEDKQYWEYNINWLLDRFPDGKYRDITGLCKAATIEGDEGIKEQDYSLNPGRYVGVVIEDDGLTQEEFEQQLISLNSELLELSENSKELQQRIMKNLSLLVNCNDE
jgi:type I restriction enzyme M protein